MASLFSLTINISKAWHSWHLQEYSSEKSGKVQPHIRMRMNTVSILYSNMELSWHKDLINLLWLFLIAYK